MQAKQSGLNHQSVSPPTIRRPSTEDHPKRTTRKSPNPRGSQGTRKNQKVQTRADRTKHPHGQDSGVQPYSPHQNIRVPQIKKKRILLTCAGTLVWSVISNCLRKIKKNPDRDLEVVMQNRISISIYNISDNNVDCNQIDNNHMLRKDNKEYTSSNLMTGEIRILQF